MSLADEILALDDLKRVKVKVPEWNMTLYVRALTGEERDAFELLVMGSDKPREERFKNLTAQLVARATTTETGERVFTESQIAELSKKNSAALRRLYNAASKLNALTDTDVEELTKN